MLDDENVDRLLCSVEAKAEARRRALDAIRVAPTVTRAFEAGPEGMALLAFGPRHEGDGEIQPDFWAD